MLILSGLVMTLGMVGGIFERIKPLNNSNREICQEIYDFEC